MPPSTDTIDVTAEEGVIVSAYAGKRLKYSCHKQPLMDDVIYWRAESMKPQSDSCKADSLENYRLALEAWREERTKEMTTTPQPQKSAAHLAVESLADRVDNLAREQSKADETILTAIRDLQGNVGILRGMIESLNEAIKHQPAQPAAPTSTPGNGTQYTTFHADTLVMTYDDSGKPSYKAKGGRFAEYGVRVWPEVLPLLHIDPASLKPGPNPISLEVKAELETKPGVDGQPQTKVKKVVGLA